MSFLLCIADVMNIVFIVKIVCKIAYTLSMFYQAEMQHQANTPMAYNKT